MACEGTGAGRNTEKLGSCVGGDCPARTLTEQTAGGLRRATEGLATLVSRDGAGNFHGAGGVHRPPDCSMDGRACDAVTVLPITPTQSSGGLREVKLLPPSVARSVWSAAAVTRRDRKQTRRREKNKTTAAGVAMPAFFGRYTAIKEKPIRISDKYDTTMTAGPCFAQASLTSPVYLSCLCGIYMIFPYLVFV